MNIIKKSWRWLALWFTAWSVVLCAGCAADVARHEFALAAADQNAQLVTARNEEQRAFVMAVDARQRAALERELDLIAEIGTREIEAHFAAEITKRTVLATTDPGAPAPEGGDARPAAASRPFVAPDDVAKLLADQRASLKATRDAIAAKRAAINAQLDAELKLWLDDPKARQQERLAAALHSYANANSEFARFLNDVGASLGVTTATKPQGGAP